MCTMPNCQTIIAGKTCSIQRKNFKKHFSSHFYTVTNQPCEKCELMDQKECFQFDIQKWFSMSLIFCIISRLYFENLIKTMHNHKCNTPKELRGIRNDATTPALWRPLSSIISSSILFQSEQLDLL